MGVLDGNSHNKYNLNGVANLAKTGKQNRGKESQSNKMEWKDSQTTIRKEKKWIHHHTKIKYTVEM